MTTCREARRWIEGAFDGHLSLSREFLLEEHLRGCARCRTRHAEEARLAELLVELTPAPAERLDVERSLAAVRAAIDRDAGRAGADPGRRRVRLGVLLAVAAASVAGVATGIWSIATSAPPAADAPELALSAGAPAEPPSDAPSDAPSDPPSDANGGAPPAPASSVSAVVVHPLLPAHALLSGVDESRLARAQDAVRERLEAAASEHLPADDAGDARPFVARFEELAAPLASESWPVGRIVMGLAGDADPLVARAALRYTGLRPTHLGVRRLREALGRADAKVAAARALADAGEPGREGLAAAFWDPDLSGLVRSSVAPLAARDPEALVRWVRSARAAAPPAAGALPPEVEALASGLPALLGTCGTAGARELCRLAGDPLVRADLVVEALASAQGAAGVLAAALDERADPSREAFLLDAVARLRPDGSYGWVHGRTWYGGDRGAAALVLATYPGFEPLFALLELEHTRRLTSDELRAAARRAVQHDPERAEAFAWERVRDGDRKASEDYADWLVRVERREAVAAALVLAEHAELTPDVRARTVLAAGEIGGAEHLVPLQRIFLGLTPGEQDVAAACLTSLHRLGGDQAVSAALAGAEAPLRSRVIELFAGDRLRERPASTFARLARELESLLRARGDDPWRTTQ